MSKYYFSWPTMGRGGFPDLDRDRVTLYKKNFEDRSEDKEIGSVSPRDIPGLLDKDCGPKWDVLDDWIKTVTDDPDALEYDWG